jgi:pyrimidine-nucleoside phosphorylase
MRMYDIIRKKRDGFSLEKEEIDFFIKGYVKGTIPDYQAAALLMAIYFNGLSTQETVMLTLAMAHSGDIIDLSGIAGIKVDKHSTGGVGDKTSLVLAPLAAAAGIPVPKMSGRGLGHTGGTIDKLESIPGFRVEMSATEFLDTVNRNGISIIAQTEDIAPADKKLYALRDVTATIDNISLIASSIMSKKIASGADSILLDVKVGQGAFMKDIDKARELARLMVEIGEGAGKNTVAVITDMSQPLGRAVGNALEVIEAVDTLKGEGPEDFQLLCTELGALMLMLGGKANSIVQGREMIKELIASRRAIDKFREFVISQGGHPQVADTPRQVLRLAPNSIGIHAPQDGYIEELHAERIGACAMLLGAGRTQKGDVINTGVGIVLDKKVGDRVFKGERLALLYYDNRDNLEHAMRLFNSAFKISDAPVQKPEVVKEYVKKS